MTRFVQWLRFALRMTAREWRAHPGALLFFSGAVALGVSVLIATDALAVGMDRTIRAEGKPLLGADLEMRSNKPFVAVTEARLDELVRRGFSVVRTVETLSMVSAASGDRQPRLSMVKAVGPGYPLYGQIRTNPPGAWQDFQNTGGVLIAPALGMQLSVSCGQPLMAGRSRLVVAGELTAEPDHLAEAFRLGPRLMMRLEDLPATKLMAPGSRALFRALIGVPPGTDVEALKAELLRPPDGAETRQGAVLDTQAGPIDRGKPWRDLEFTTAEEGPEGTRRLVVRVGAFLGLAGLCVLLLCGVATAMAIHTYVSQRVDSLAILKCLGATGRGLVGLMLFETSTLAGLGSALGVAAGLLLAGRLPALMAGVFPFPLEMAFDWQIVGRGAAIAMLTTIGFGAVPLLSLRRLPATAVFRRDYEQQGGPGIDPAVAAAAATLVGAVLFLVRGRAGSTELAFWFAGGFSFALASLAAGAKAVVWALRRLTPAFGFELRQAMANLRRPGNQTATIIVAVGLSVDLVLLVNVLKGRILDELAGGVRDSAPNLFVIDIQPDQKARVEKLLRDRGHPPEELVPLVRSRVSKIQDRSVHQIYPIPADAPWCIHRDYWLSYRDGLSPSEQLVAGKLWTGPVSPGAAEVSVEERTAARFGVDLGDLLTLDVAGVDVTARVTSLRRVRWSTMRPNFFLLFPPGVLEGAPQTYFAVASVPGERQRVELTRELVDLYANLTIIDLSAAAATVRLVLDRAAAVVLLVAAACAWGGGLLLVSSLMLTRRHRLHEMALLKLLGARRGVLVRLLAWEYLMLGTVAGALGSASAMVSARAMAVQLFDVSVSLDPWAIVAATAASATFVTVCGSLASAGLLGRPPSEILRSE
ncbi:MAG: FtsX-like permease family protein [Candidatus Wallbacteria bacterium]|nr:FtsX-like permease family protein [Candidatus Wallbacteria bacterium]